MRDEQSQISVYGREATSFEKETSGQRYHCGRRQSDHHLTRILPIVHDAMHCPCTCHTQETRPKADTQDVYVMYSSRLHWSLLALLLSGASSKWNHTRDFPLSCRWRQWPNVEQLHHICPWHTGREEQMSCALDVRLRKIKEIMMGAWSLTGSVLRTTKSVTDHAARSVEQDNALPRHTHDPVLTWKPFGPHMSVALVRHVNPWPRDARKWTNP